jgi:1,4-dihydroxy-2-naphthoate octaprenyltransferase
MSYKTIVKTIGKTARPSFLILSPLCIFLALSAVYYNGLVINYTTAALLFSGAILAHISVNMLNEYFDFKSGLDFKTTKTPFSGGSGALIQQPNMAKKVLMFASLSLLITIGIGIYMVYEHGYF